VSLLSWGFHLGSYKVSWKPDMENYIKGFRFCRSIFDLDKNLILFRSAFWFINRQRFLSLSAFALLFSETSFEVRRPLGHKRILSLVEWFPGTLTNFRIYIQNLYRYGLRGLANSLRRYFFLKRWIFFPHAFINLNAQKVTMSAFFYESLDAPSAEAGKLLLPYSTLLSSAQAGVSQVFYPLLGEQSALASFLVRIFIKTLSFLRIKFSKRIYLKKRVFSNKYLKNKVFLDKGIKFLIPFCRWPLHYKRKFFIKKFKSIYVDPFFILHI